MLATGITYSLASRGLGQPGLTTAYVQPYVRMPPPCHCMQHNIHSVLYYGRLVDQEM